MTFTPSPRGIPPEAVYHPGVAMVSLGIWLVPPVAMCLCRQCRKAREMAK